MILEPKRLTRQTAQDGLWKLVAALQEHPRIVLLSGQIEFRLLHGADRWPTVVQWQVGQTKILSRADALQIAGLLEQVSLAELGRDVLSAFGLQIVWVGPAGISSLRGRQGDREEASA